MRQKHPFLFALDATPNKTISTTRLPFILSKIMRKIVQRKTRDFSNSDFSLFSFFDSWFGYLWPKSFFH